MNPHDHANLIFDKDAKNLLWRKDILPTNVAGKTEYLPQEN
jgi:hypothetical protein